MAKRELPEQLQFMANRRAVQKTTDASMRGKVCVVAGSTSGVGLAAIRRLARAGADIVMVCRNRGKAEPIRDEIARSCGVRVDIVTADFRDLASVRAAAGVLRVKFECGLFDHPYADVDLLQRVTRSAEHRRPQ